MDRTEQLMEIICKHIQTGECLARCDDDKCLQVKDFIKEIQIEAVKKFASKVERQCIDSGIYPACVRRALERTLDEMTVGGESDA